MNIANVHPHMGSQWRSGGAQNGSIRNCCNSLPWLGAHLLYSPLYLLFALAAFVGVLRGLTGLLWDAAGYMLGWVERGVL